MTAWNFLSASAIWPYSMITRKDRLQFILRSAAKNGVEVLYACESGSRAWGLASSDSDYDLRFVYRHAPEWYLTLHPGRDQIGPILEHDGELDLVGWDVRKFLKHLTAGNPNCLEWLNSPIVYHHLGDFPDRCNKLADAYFRPRRAVHHYLGIARGARGAGEKEAGHWNTKKACYWMRSLLAAAYVADRLSRPPITLVELLPQIAQERVRADLRMYVDRKCILDEKDIVPLPISLEEYFNESAERLSDRATTLAEQSVDPEAGNAFFREISGWTP